LRNPKFCNSVPKPLISYILFSQLGPVQFLRPWF